MNRFFVFLFWFAVFMAFAALLVNSPLIDRLLSDMSRYLPVNSHDRASARFFESRRQFDDRAKQLSELATLRTKLLRDRVSLLRESQGARRNFQDAATAFLNGVEPQASSAGLRKDMEALKDHLIAFSGPNGRAEDADKFYQKALELKERLREGPTLAGTSSQSDAALAQLEKLNDHFRSLDDDLAFQKGLLDKVSGRARESQDKLRGLGEQLAAQRASEVSMAERMASRSAIMQDHFEAQMSRFASMQDRTALQLERAYAQQAQMSDRMQMMGDRMDSQFSRLGAALERAAAHSDRLQSMQERTSRIQQRSSALEP